MKWLIGSAISYFSPGRGKAAQPEMENRGQLAVTRHTNPDERKLWDSCSATCGLNRKQAGILYADIADYSRLTEQDEEGVLTS